MFSPGLALDSPTHTISRFTQLFVVLIPRPKYITYTPKYQLSSARSFQALVTDSLPRYPPFKIVG